MRPNRWQLPRDLRPVLFPWSAVPLHPVHYPHPLRIVQGSPIRESVQSRDSHPSTSTTSRAGQTSALTCKNRTRAPAYTRIAYQTNACAVQIHRTRSGSLHILQGLAPEQPGHYPQAAATASCCRSTSRRHALPSGERSQASTSAAIASNSRCASRSQSFAFVFTPHGPFVVYGYSSPTRAGIRAGWDPPHPVRIPSARFPWMHPHPRPVLFPWSAQDRRTGQPLERIAVRRRLTASGAALILPA